MSDKQRIFNPLRVFPGRKPGAGSEKPQLIVSLAGLPNPNFENEFTKYRSFGARMRAAAGAGKMWNNYVVFTHVDLLLKAALFLRTF